MPFGPKEVGPKRLPAVVPLVSGSNTSLSRTYPPAPDRNDAFDDHGPRALLTAALTRQVCGWSNTSVQLGVHETVEPEPPPTTVGPQTVVLPEFLISNS